jgi:hypothetical protein
LATTPNTSSPAANPDTPMPTPSLHADELLPDGLSEQRLVTHSGQQPENDRRVLPGGVGAHDIEHRDQVLLRALPPRCRLHDVRPGRYLFVPRQLPSTERPNRPGRSAVLAV